jgi:hypothetical protein
MSNEGESHSANLKGTGKKWWWHISKYNPGIRFERLKINTKNSLSELYSIQ